MNKKMSLALVSLLSLSFISCTNKNNNETFYQIEKGLYVNALPGFYDEGFDLKFKFDNKESKVYYSLDSSIPTESSLLYDKSIYIDKVSSKDKKDYPLTTSVDGILAKDEGGKVQSQAYINNIQKMNKYNLIDKECVLTINYINDKGESKVRSLTYIFNDYKIPVVSLSMPYDEWFGKEGMYNNIRIEYEKRADLEYFDPVYDSYFYRNTQVKIGGNYTMGYPQRTLNLNFNKDQFGNKQEKVKVKIFGDQKAEDGSDLDSFTRFRLHNGGNCFENYTGFNDAVLQGMMEGSNCSTTSARPCVVYLNGEFWGLYTIREHYKDVYFSSNYGVEKDDVALYDYTGKFVFNDGDDSDFEEFFNSMDSYLDKNFKDNKVYNEFINTYIDKDSFIDVMVAQSFGCNRDFVGNNNNLKAWRTTKVDDSNPYADGKLRFCLHDADFALTDASYWNFLDRDVSNSYSRFKLFRKCLENELFQKDFYNRAEELIESNLSYENACKVLDNLVSQVEDYKLSSNKRWGLYMWGYEVNGINKVGLDGWYYEIDYVKYFVNTRINNTDEFKEENGNENERNYLEAIIESFKEY